MNVYEKVLEEAQWSIDAGDRDLDKVLMEAFESNTEGDYLWELLHDEFEPNALLRMLEGDAKYSVWEALYDRVYGQVMGDLKQYAEDHIWTVYYCGGPRESDWYDYNEVYTREEFEEEVDDLVGDGFLLISIYDNDAYLEEVEEEEE